MLHGFDLRGFLEDTRKIVADTDPAKVAAENEAKKGARERRISAPRLVDTILNARRQRTTTRKNRATQKKGLRVMGHDRNRWLRKTGRQVKRDLTVSEREMFRKMFVLLDRDKGGTLDVEEIATAIRALGLKVDRADILRQVTSVSKTGEMNFDAFVEFMTRNVDEAADKGPRKAGEDDGDEADEAEGDHPTADEDDNLPFNLWIPAYQRRKNMETFMSLKHLHDIEDHIALPTIEGGAEEGGTEGAEDASGGLVDEHAAARDDDDGSLHPVASVATGSISCKSENSPASPRRHSLAVRRSSLVGMTELALQFRPEPPSAPQSARRAPAASHSPVVAKPRSQHRRSSVGGISGVEGRNARRPGRRRSSSVAGVNPGAAGTELLYRGRRNSAPVPFLLPYRISAFELHLLHQNKVLKARQEEARRASGGKWQPPLRLIDVKHEIEVETDAVRKAREQWEAYCKRKEEEPGGEEAV